MLTFAVFVFEDIHFDYEPNYHQCIFPNQVSTQLVIRDGSRLNCVTEAGAVVSFKLFKEHLSHPVTGSSNQYPKSSDPNRCY